MNTSLLRAIAALFALTFVAAACASDTGAEWTFAPVTAERAADAAPTTEPAAPEPTAAAVEATAPPEVSPQPGMTAEPAPPSGEPRVIALLADSALRFTDLDGQPIPDIPVVPGETIRFEVNNTAGFGHNLWIGTDAELSTFGATTDVGIPDWTNGVEVLEWVVPEDIAGLKFACTVAGHYYTMQGTFSVAEGGTPAEPEVSAAPAEPDTTAEPAEPEVTAAPAEPEPTAAPAEPPSGEARVIDLEADAAIRFLQDGQQIRNIEVTPGETVVFRIENTAGFAHNFYIGPDAELQQPNGRTDIGLPDWDIGFQELEWVVPDDLSNLRFACTVPGHYFTMQGDFVVSP